MLFVVLVLCCCVVVVLLLCVVQKDSPINCDGRDWRRGNLRIGVSFKIRMPPLDSTLWVSDMWSLSSSENSEGRPICACRKPDATWCQDLQGQHLHSTVSLLVAVDEMTGTTDGFCLPVDSSDSEVACVPLGMTRNLLVGRL